jgi:hypothetical protein
MVGEEGQNSMNAERSNQPCERCQVLRKELEAVVKELDEAHTAYVRDIGQSEESHWRMVWIFQDRANGAAEECERLEAENMELRRTINALRQWN